MSCGCREKLNTELKAALDTTCAAVQSVAALLLSTYFLNDWPAHVLNKHKVSSSYIWRPVQRPTPFVVRQVCYLGGKIFITFIKLKEVALREELSLLLETTVHQDGRVRGAHPSRFNMSNRYVRPLAQQAVSNGRLILGHLKLIVCAFRRNNKSITENKQQENILLVRTDPEGQEMSRLTLCAPPWWSFPQPQGDICASEGHGPDAPDGPCKLHRISMSDVLSCGHKTIFLPLLSFKQHTSHPPRQLSIVIVAIDTI